MIVVAAFEEQCTLIKRSMAKMAKPVIDSTAIKECLNLPESTVAIKRRLCEAKVGGQEAPVKSHC